MDAYARIVEPHSGAAKALNGAVEDHTGAEKDHIREVEAGGSLRSCAGNLELKSQRIVESWRINFKPC